jgi:hypothetical protein
MPTVAVEPRLQCTALYDQQLNEVEKSGDLLVVHANSKDNAYAEANHAIVDKAQSLGQELHDRVTAVLVWDGKFRSHGDLTEEFGVYARNRSIPVVDVVLYENALRARETEPAYRHRMISLDCGEGAIVVTEPQSVPLQGQGGKSDAQQIGRPKRVTRSGRICRCYWEGEDVRCDLNSLQLSGNV